MKWANSITKFLIVLMLLRGSSLGAELALPDLAKFSLEELMNMEVTSAAKREQKLATVAAAIHVITQEEIRRSGATTIAEALRLAPGLSVARIDSNKWAITSRGFNSSFANKLLVLIDGRSVYTPLFSGVYWDVQDTVLEDIERIEVIRGPAGSLWGANAVNGVINIITKNAKDTQGGLLTMGGGNEERGFGQLRYGASIGEDVKFRVYGKYSNRDNFTNGSNLRANDGWHVGQRGFRLDGSFGAMDTLTLQSDYYDGKDSQVNQISSLGAPYSATVMAESPISGGNLLGRWQHRFSATSELKVQAYYGRTDRFLPVASEVRQTVDIDVQHSFAPADWHHLTWGGGYRFTTAALKDSFTISFDNLRKRDQLANVFFQSDFEIVPDRLRFTLGSKLEHNDYTGFEVQPNARISWSVNPNHTVWGAISRAVRTPAQFENDVRANLAALPGPSASCPFAGTCLVSVFGSKTFKAEKLIAYEIGYRGQLTPRWSADIATFYNVYNDLRTTEPGAPFVEAAPAPVHLNVPYTLANNLIGRAFGVELETRWSPTDSWKLIAGYTFFKLALDLDHGSGSAKLSAVDGESPQHQFQVRSLLELPYNFQFDAALYRVGRLSTLDVPAYTRVDLRLGYHQIAGIESWSAKSVRPAAS